MFFLTSFLLLTVAVSTKAQPPVTFFPGVDAAFTYAWGSAFYRELGVLPSIAACAAAAAAWRNASSPSERCLSATLFLAPRNTSLLHACVCLITPKWVPLATPAADSARLLWPCATAEDCSYNGVCNASAACACDPAWGGPRCSELQLLPVGTSISPLSAHYSICDLRFAIAICYLPITEPLSGALTPFAQLAKKTPRTRACGSQTLPGTM